MVSSVHQIEAVGAGSPSGPAVEAQRGHRVGVHPGRGEMPGADHRPRFAEHDIHQVHRVRTEIEDGAAGQLGIQQPVVLRSVEGEAEAGFDVADLADLAGPVRPRPPCGSAGLVRVQTASMQNNPRSRTSAINSSACSAVAVSGFSTSTDRPASRQRLGRVEVVTVRSGHVDHVDLGVGGQLGVAAVGPGEAVVVGECLGLGQLAGGDRDQFGLVRQQAEIAGEHAGDVPGAQHPPPDSRRSGVAGGGTRSAEARHETIQAQAGSAKQCRAVWPG